MPKGQHPAEARKSENGPPRRAAIYARNSEGTREEKHSPEAQVAVCRERCDREKWDVKFIVVEDDTKVDLPVRDKFYVLMERAARREFDVLLAWKLDRVCRSLHDTVRLQRFLSQFDISLVSVTEPFDMSSTYGKFTFNVMASVAELERGLISERTRLGKKARSRQFKWPHQRPPLGYSVDEKGYLVPNLGEIPILTFIWDTYLETKSGPEVVFRLRERGTLNRYGKAYTLPDIYRALDNEIYVGHYQVGGVDEHVEPYRLIADDRFFGMRMIRRRPEIRTPRMRTERRKHHIDRVFAQWQELNDEPVEELFDDSIGIEAFRPVGRKRKDQLPLTKTSTGVGVPGSA